MPVHSCIGWEVHAQLQLPFHNQGNLVQARVVMSRLQGTRHMMGGQLMKPFADCVRRRQLLPITLLAAGLFSIGSVAGIADTSKPVALKIGSAVSLSGELASIGKTNDAAARMAAKYIMESAKAAGMNAD